MEYKFVDLINGIENLPEDLLTYNSILYRIYNSSNGKNYIGTAKHGLPSRLYDRSYGHITHYRWKTEFKCQGMYIDMNLNLSSFSLIIEKELNSKMYDEILELETEYIKKFDSVLNGYNVSPDGKPGWKIGTTCITNDVYDLYVYQEDLDRFISSGRYRIGSCKHSHLKGFIYVTNSKEDRMIDKDDFDEFKSLGYKKGRSLSPNKNKVWRNNGSVSRLLSSDDLNNDKFKDFIYIGRIEPPRKPRGKYNSPKKKAVNNGKEVKLVPESEVENFLNNNPQYSLGKLKFMIVSNDELGITKHINESDFQSYRLKGFRKGRIKKDKIDHLS